MRARSYQASPGPAKANALCISLWMIQVNMLVNHCMAVDGRACGKVDNRWDPASCRWWPRPLSTDGVRYPQPACGCGTCYHSAGMPLNFRFTGSAQRMASSDSRRESNWFSAAT